MKKILYTLLAGVMALSSCSKSDDVPTPSQNDNTTTFTLAVDGATTRATSTITPARYVMEVWSEDGLTAENVFDNGTKNHAEITSGSAFTVTLDKTKAYTCLFWADDNAAFDATNLKAIAVNADKSATEAYFSKVAVAKGKNPTVAVTLKRAVAKITLTEAAGVKTADDIALKLTNIYPTFNVLAGEASGTAAEWTKTVKPSATTGTIASFYFFAKTDKELSDLKFTYATETPKTVSNIPIQQNHATNIKGEYSSMFAGTFAIDADDEWMTPDNEVNFGEKAVYKLGDIYPDATAPIGVVFWVDETDPTYNSTDKTSAKGKIVSLDEATPIKWSTESINTSATDHNDGAVNTLKVFALASYTAEKYPAFAWCATKNTTVPAGISWYIPAINESRNGIYGNRAILNTSLNAAGATELSNDYYWLSSQGDEITAWFIHLGNNYLNVSFKYDVNRVRVVSAF